MRPRSVIEYAGSRFPSSRRLPGAHPNAQRAHKRAAALHDGSMRSDCRGAAAWTPLGVALLAVSIAPASALRGGKSPSGPRQLDHVTPQARMEYLRKAIVWRPTRIPAMDLMRGPEGEGAFKPDQSVTCEYVKPDEPMSGATPKFTCDLGGGDVVKVKYGKNNGEVYAEVAASRLLWALGFGADHMYPVQVTCRDCPIEPWYWSSEPRVDEKKFELATIERKLDGKTIEASGKEGWTWAELDRVDERAGGAPVAHRDALKLLAVLLQYSDTKAQNQRLVCLPDSFVRNESGDEDCTKPLMFPQDLGVVFGKANLLNNDSVNLQSWQDVPVWRDPRQCVAHLKKSLTGTLEHPRISEAGRKFLADLLSQLSDTQIRDMFAVARFDRRGRKIRTPQGERPATIDDWVGVFKKKRDEIVNARCPQ